MPTVTHPLLSMAATAQAVAHTQHHHGPVAQIVLFLIVMGFPQRLQVVILKASTICVVYDGLIAPFVQIYDCIYGWNGWIAVFIMHHLDLIRSRAAAAPSFHEGHPRHDPHMGLQAHKGTYSLVVHVHGFFVMMKLLENVAWETKQNLRTRRPIMVMSIYERRFGSTYPCRSHSRKR
ncbi:hypothetical protein ZWY2020_033899 [Hordeum vulgare]|nr:hypothetical protein ZWY2020_033899 [Hordeum vulgare]